tara:strand:+ start:1274 stop:2062 length:789 start_codon:yes stop_codon:yes gene_type:complete
VIKLALVNQPAGLGDVLYTLNIGKKLVEQGYQVLWPLIQQYMWLSKCIYIPGVKFISEDKIPQNLQNLYRSRYSNVIKEKDFAYFPLRYVLLNQEVGIEDLPMLSKYMLADMTKDAFSWWELFGDALVLYPSKGEALFEKKQCGSTYFYVNDLVGSPDGKHLHTVESMNKNIYKTQIVRNCLEENYSLFDWWLILDKAKEIHTPDTGICFFVDILRNCFNLCKSTKFYMYPRDLNRPNVPQYLTSCFTFTNENRNGWNFVKP